MAIVVDHFVQFQVVANTFRLLEEAASLRVNVSKTVYIPLYATTKEQARKDVSGCEWRGMDINLQAGKYLGFYVGPGADASLNLRSAFTKFRTRALYRHLRN